jgi:uncharacterized protein (DUF924 family)
VRRLGKHLGRRYRSCYTVSQSDPLALAIVRDRVFPTGLDVDPSIGGPANGVARTFFLLPLLHAEDLAAQDEGVALTERMREATSEAHAGVVRARVEAAPRHRALVARFGRYPHRNAALGREDTEEERQWRIETGGRPFG